MTPMDEHHEHSGLYPSGLDEILRRIGEAGDDDRGSDASEGDCASRVVVQSRDPS